MNIFYRNYLGTTASGGKLVGMKCDVTNEDDVKSVFSYAKDQFGGIDVCVNNAGLSHNAPLLTGDTKDWRNMLDVSNTNDSWSHCIY